MLKGKVMIILLIDGSIKKILYKISQNLPKPYRSFGRMSKLNYIYPVMQQKQN